MQTRQIIQHLKHFMAAADLSFSPDVPTAEQKIIFSYYTQILPTLQHLKMRKLKMPTIDARFVQLYNEHLYPYLWLYTQREPSYWANIKEYGIKLEEYDRLNAGRRALRKAWAAAYSKPSKKLMAAQ